MNKICRKSDTKSWSNQKCKGIFYIYENLKDSFMIISRDRQEIWGKHTIKPGVAFTQITLASLGFRLACLKSLSWISITSCDGNNSRDKMKCWKLETQITGAALKQRRHGAQELAQRWKRNKQTNTEQKIFQLLMLREILIYLFSVQMPFVLRALR